MIKQEYPPNQMSLIEQILSKLHLKSIDQLLQNENINIEYIAKATNLHKTVIIQLLNQLKTLINQPDEIVCPQKYSIKINEVVKLWVDYSDNNQVQQSVFEAKIQKLNKIQVGSSQIIEVIGRANSGKSYFIFSFMLDCLQKGLTVIFLDSSHNYEGFIKFLNQRFSYNETKISKVVRKLIYFKFESLSQFSILFHNLGNQLIAKKNNQQSLIKSGVIVFIDCLSRIQLADPETDEQNSTMDFDIIEKLKRLLVTFSIRVCSIIYTNRIPTAYTLFQTYYKNEKHRPRCKNNNAKLWDSIASKTICIDYTRTMGLNEVKKIHFTKQFNNQVITFEKKISK